MISESGPSAGFQASFAAPSSLAAMLSNIYGNNSTRLDFGF
jgi:hypothetical protein